MIPRSSYLRVGESLVQQETIQESRQVIEVFVNNGYSRDFITDILELLTTKDVNRILKNLPELKIKLENLSEDIIRWLTKN